jgi:hypothetical protein
MHFFFVFSVTDVFPQVSLNFAGGASMNLRPQDYLLQQNSVVSMQVFVAHLLHSSVSILSQYMDNGLLFSFFNLGAFHFTG